MQKKYNKLNNNCIVRKRFTGKTIVVAISMLLILTAYTTAALQNSKPFSLKEMNGRSIVWDVSILCNNAGGQNDYVVFGEAPDANDGPPVDIYDVLKPPAPQTPYIRTWLNDNLPYPYDVLTMDYRFYPDTSKIWNLTIHWMPSGGASPTTITVSWNTSEFTGSEYTSVTLTSEGGTPLQNMLVNTTYIFSCPAYVPQNFKIICNATGGNLPPIANPDSYSTNEDTTLNVVAPGVLANDNDSDGDPLTAVKQSEPSHGAVTLNSNGGFMYIPTANYYGSDSFTYKAYDGNLYSNLATVTITVNAVNDPPVVTNIPDQTIAEGSSFSTITLDNYVSDVDNTDAQITWTYSGNIQLTVSIVNRVATISPPNLDWNGVETITFRATDPGGLWDDDPATFTVTAVNDPPVVGDIPGQTITEGSSFATITLDNYVSDIDNPDTQMTWTYSGNVQLTVSIVNRVATITTPNADWYGSETITFRATDPGGLWDEDPATFTVTNVNDPPVVSDIPSQTITEGSSFATITLDNYVSDIDNPDTQMTWTYSGNVELSVSIVNRVATITTPNADWYGSETITFRATDPGGLWDDDPATFTVTPVNDPPVANPDSYTTNENTPLTVPAPGVLGNDVDVDGDDLTATKVSDPSHGMVVLNSDGSFTYTPEEDYQGIDTFTYKAFDGTVYSNVTTVTITVYPVNQPPVAGDDTATVPFDSSNNKIDVLANDEDPDGDNLTITDVSAASHGTTSTDGDYVYYTPIIGYSGDDSFTYTIDDGNGGTDSGMVSIIVQPNNPPLKPPRPTGPTSGEIDVEYAFNAITTDPNNHQLYYQWDWGDGATSDWLGPYDSGELIQAKHTWNETGSYAIKVRAKDTYNAESSWSDPSDITITTSAFSVEIKGGLGVKLVITNEGTSDATAVDWQIHVQGGLFKFINKTKSGTVYIPAGESVTVSTGLILGLGKISIDTQVAGSEKTAQGFVLFFFVLGVKDTANSTNWYGR